MPKFMFMRFFTQFPALSVAALLTISSSPAFAQPPLEKAKSPMAEMSDRLWSVFAKAPGNLVYSPASISLALAMTSAGTASRTEAEILRAFGISPAEDPLAASTSLHRSFGSLLKELSLPELSIANRLWAQKGYPFLKPFIALTGDQYGAELQAVDYAGDTERARKTINDWVSRQTREKIPELLKPGILNSLTRMVLTNAIYFKGRWETEFKKSETREEPFFPAGGKPRNVPTMHLKGNFHYFEDRETQWLELPYQGDRLSAIILLPKSRDGLRAGNQVFRSAKVEEFMRAMGHEEVLISLPRFTLRQNTDLNSKLQALGIRDAFSPKDADFSRMNGKKADLFLTKVVHEAFIDVNEEGTEAAAATAGVVGLKGMAAMPVTFRADHPFLFLIRENPTGLILFAARVEDPAAG